jgi:hypothetical protein
MKKICRVTGKVIASGLLGIILFLASIYLGAALTPASDHPDVVEGWAAAMLLIIGMLLAIFLSGIVAVLLTFKDISSLKEALAVTFFSALIAMMAPLLLGIFLGTYSAGLFYLCLAVVVFCIILSMAGGIAVFLLLRFLKRKKNSAGTN